MALDAKDVLLFGQAHDGRRKRLGIGHFRQLDHHRVEIIMFMVVLAVMVRRAGGNVIFSRSVQAEDHARVDHAIGHRQHRHSAGHLGADHLTGGGKARVTRKIGLGQKDQIGAQDLVFEDLGQRGFMVKAWVGGTLGIDCGDIGGKAPGGHGFGIGKGDHAINGDLRADGRPVKRLEQGLRQCQARGFDQDMVGADGHGHQGLDRGDEVIGDSAADAAVGQFHDVFHRAVFIGAGLQDVAVNAHGAKLVHQDRQPLALRVLHQVADQRGLARPKKAGDHGHGDFGQIGRCGIHSAASSRGFCGGMRAMLCLRKTVGRSRHGTIPSRLAAYFPAPSRMAGTSSSERRP